VRSSTVPVVMLAARIQASHCDNGADHDLPTVSFPMPSVNDLMREKETTFPRLWITPPQMHSGHPQAGKA